MSETAARQDSSSEHDQHSANDNNDDGGTDAPESTRSAISVRSEQQDSSDLVAASPSSSITTTTIYELVMQQRWTDVLNRCTSNPQELAYVDGNGYTALHVACQRDPPPDALRALVDCHLRYFPLVHGDVSGSNVSLIPTPLHLACERCRSGTGKSGASAEAVSVLLNALGPLKSTSMRYRGSVPLHVACLEGAAQCDVIETLLQANWDSASYRDNHGSTPFLCAIFSSKRTNGATPTMEVLRLLLEMNPNLATMANYRGVTRASAMWESLPLSDVSRLQQMTSLGELRRDAKLSNFWDKMELVLRASARGSNAFTTAEEDDDDGGAGEEWRLLHAVIRSSTNPGVVADVNMTKYQKIVIRLYAHQALERDSGEGRTPLAIAAASSVGGVRATFLINELLNVNVAAARIPDADGRLPLHLAIGSGGGGKQWSSGIKCLVDAAPEVLRARDVQSHLYPFMLAAQASSSGDEGHGNEGEEEEGDDDSISGLTTVYELICACPELMHRFIIETDE